MPAKNAPAKKTPAKKIAPKPKPSLYELAATKAIAKNPKAPGYAAAIAVIEALIKNAPTKTTVAFLNTALLATKGGKGQDGGDPTPDPPFPGSRAK